MYEITELDNFYVNQAAVSLNQDMHIGIESVIKYVKKCVHVLTKAEFTDLIESRVDYYCNEHGLYQMQDACNQAIFDRLCDEFMFSIANNMQFLGLFMDKVVMPSSKLREFLVDYMVSETRAKIGW